MFKRITTLFIAFSTSFFVLSQEGVIQGRVVDRVDGQAMGGVSIYLDGKSNTASDRDGQFILQTEPGKRVLLFQFIGYRDTTLEVEVQAEDTAHIEIKMDTEASTLGMVVISAGKFEQRLEEVTVSMEVIEKDFVQDRNTTNMEDLMNQVPGVTMLDGQANIRGGSGFSYGAGSRVMILVDDMPLLTADAGDVKWNFIPVENTEQVEVIKGASSALFGSSAMNGVINFRSAYPKDSAKTHASVSTGIYDRPSRDSLVWWGTSSRSFANVSGAHSRPIGNFDLVLGVNHYSDQGFRKDETEDRSRVNFGTRYRIKKIDGLSAGVNGNYMDVQGGIFLLWKNADSAWWPSGDSGSIFHSKRFHIDPYVTYFTKKNHKHSLKTRYFRARNQNNTDQESLSDVWFGDYQFQIRAQNDLTITQGTSGSYGEVISDSLYGDHFTTNLSYYAQLDKKWKRWVFNFGLRTEYYKVDSSETNFKYGKKNSIPVYPVLRSGLNFRVAKHTYLRSSFGQGYRFPSVAEKFISTQSGGLTIYPNPDLQPETGWSAELGVKQALQLGNCQGYIDLAGFWQEYNNMMEFTFGYWVPPGTPNPPPVLTLFKYFGAKSINVGRARITGAELSAAIKCKIGKAELTFLGGYTYTHPIDLEYDPDSTGGTFDGNLLKYRYEHLSRVDVQLKWKRITTGISLRHNSFMRNIDRSFQQEIFSDIDTSIHTNQYILPGLEEYRNEHDRGDVVIDLRGGVNVAKAFRVSLLANNLLNREYMGRPGDIRAPRNFSAMLEARF